MELDLYVHQLYNVGARVQSGTLRHKGVHNGTFKREEITGGVAESIRGG